MNRKVTRFAGAEIIEEYFIDVEWPTIREKRNSALKESDWRAVKDRTMSQAWIDYRTALRDLPQNYDSANDAADNFPSPPE